MFRVYQSAVSTSRETIEVSSKITNISDLDTERLGMKFKNGKITG